VLQAEETPVVFEDVRDSEGDLLAEELPYQKPCTLEALSAAASGGFVGALYGFGEPTVHAGDENKSNSDISNVCRHMSFTLNECTPFSRKLWSCSLH